MTDELIPFAESLGVAGASGHALELTLAQQRHLRELWADRPPDVDRWELELERRAQARRWAKVRAIAVAMLQGLELELNAGDVPNGELRRFLQDVRDELELAGRVLKVDVRPALERLASVALKAAKR